MRDYKCEFCGVEDVKLWRDYGTPFNWQLWCVDCACSKSDINPSTVRADGTRIIHTHYFDRYTRRGLVRFAGEVFHDMLDDSRVERREDVTDQLGWYVPAVQSLKDPDVYWGYSSYTEKRKPDFDAWNALPLRPLIAADVYGGA